MKTQIKRSKDEDYDYSNYIVWNDFVELTPKKQTAYKT